MQQTSEHLIAYQTVSLLAYQRLRETLVQQRQMFESVVTESQIGRPQTKRAQTEALESFVLMCSPTLNVLLTAMPVENSPLKAVQTKPVKRRMASKRARFQGEDREQAISQGSKQHVEYRVGLTFDDRAIAVFINRLNIASAKGRKRHRAEESKIPDISRAPNDASLFSQHESASVSEDDRLIAQKSFVLAWAKNLATSPEGDTQPSQTALDNQVQQGLLLEQLVTRIRHSLDLPAILKTTVAQVREFLCADRLVLYQFDHFECEQLDDTETFLSSAVSTLETKQQAADTLSGQRAHSGHITYESRASECVRSVLHASEERCFSPSLSMRARYLTGKPIAIDNIDEQYAKVACLLAFLRQAEVKSKIIAPIIVQGRLWGLLIAHQCQDYRHWENTESVFLQHIAEHLAIAISQASLYQQLRQQTVSLESCVIERTQSLHDALVAAESANVTKGEFLSTMSHELRTPLTYIIGMSATLLRWSLGDLNERQRGYLATINQSGEQLLDIINNVLEFASVESGRSLLDFTETSLTQLMTKVVSRHQEMADKQNVSLALTLKVADEEDLFRADVKRLQLIVGNLVHNAIKFTGADGHVNVRVWRDAKTAIFQVQDTGIGISESQRGVLFEQFKQLESPFQRQYSGMGLGLAMTKRLVELHGGSIQVDSQVGKGSTFTVQLPVQREPSIPKHYQLPADFKGGAERIILLEEDEAAAAIACEMLTEAGYEVIWLVQPEDLLPKLELLQPAMLIADLSLLDLRSSDVKAIQRAIAAFDTRVLALCASQASAASPVAHHDVLYRPIDPELLLTRVRQLIQLTV